jgi:parallel beta-helix repeat protein
MLISGAVFALILAGLLTLTFNIKQAKSEWTGTVYIRANGSIDPPDAPIITYDKVTYTLTDNITSSADGIVVERDNIVIDGAGYTVKGPGYTPGGYPSWGISLGRISNVTIKNFLVKKFERGIYLHNSTYCRIEGNTLTNNTFGINIGWSSSNNIISGNVFVNDGLAVGDSYENTVVNNLVNGKPLVYLENMSDYVVGDAGQVVLVNCTGITVKNLNLSNTAIGVQLWNTNNTNIAKNYITNNIIGILMDLSSNNNIQENNITNNMCGVWAESMGYFNSIGRNTITNNSVGVSLLSSFTYIERNTITCNEHGISFWAFVSNNHIQENNITYNQVAIYLGLPSYNTVICHNNFIDNKQVYKEYYMHSTPVRALWNDGYPSGGNYWSNYTGVDLYSGPYQNETGSDGIEDTPYIIDANNTDHYPLMAPFNSFEAGVWDGTTYDVDVISNSTISGFNFDVDQKSVNFNVTGDEGTIGFCRVAIPKTLLWVDNGWTIFVGDQPITDYTIIPDENYTYLYFTYSHSTKTITIQGTHAIPEFPSTPILMLLMLTTLITTTLWKTKRKRQPP